MDEHTLTMAEMPSHSHYSFTNYSLPKGAIIYSPERLHFGTGWRELQSWENPHPNLFGYEKTNA